MLATTACVIPAYGRVAMTREVVRSCFAELRPETVVVVDNKGDYEPVGGESVRCRGQALGWLGGSNAGMSWAFDELGVDGVVLMNNDVVLSTGFFAGLDAADGPGVGLVAPCYDDSFKSQHRYWTGPAGRFPAQPVEEEVRLVDGTALLVTRACHEAVGPLDAEHFGRFGWGATADYCARASAQGLRVLVTRRSYVNHAGGVTAHDVTNAYERDALLEMELGLTAKYGPAWRRDLGYARDGSGLNTLWDRLYYSYRNLVTPRWRAPQ